jgi:hypothetical protein
LNYIAWTQAEAMADPSGTAIQISSKEVRRGEAEMGEFDG